MPLSIAIPISNSIIIHSFLLIWVFYWYFTALDFPKWTLYKLRHGSDSYIEWCTQLVLWTPKIKIAEAVKSRRISIWSVPPRWLLQLFLWCDMIRTESMNEPTNEWTNQRMNQRNENEFVLHVSILSVNDSDGHGWSGSNLIKEIGSLNATYVFVRWKLGANEHVRWNVFLWDLFR